MSRKKKELARKKILAMPWWKSKDNWYFISIFFALIIIVGLAA